MKKKLLCMVIALVTLITLASCRSNPTTPPQNEETHNTNPSENTTSPSENTTLPSEDTTEHDVVEDQVDESLCEKLIREIDGTYAEESKLPESSTTVGKVELADKYTKKWQQVADEYYNKIMAFDENIAPSEIYYSTDDLHTFVSNMKISWEQYYQEQCENYIKTLQAIYNGGTIVGPIFAVYKYEMQKEWALQMVGICQLLFIE